jgi:hypothetical protein
MFTKRWILNKILEKVNKIMATQADLDAAIAALPAKLEAAIEAAVQPIIDAIKAKGGADLQPEIDALNAVGDTVAAQVATDLAANNP